MSDDDDRPIEESFKKFKKSNKKRRFVDTLPDNLKDMYNEEVKKVLKPRDPRFDPKVPGSYCPDQVEFYKEKQIALIKEMTDKLEDPNLSEEERNKCNLIITKFKQKQNNLKMLNSKAKFMDDINSSYIKEMESGKLPKFMKKKEIKMKMKEHLNSTKSSKAIEKAERKREFKKLKKERLLESKIV